MSKHIESKDQLKW